MTEERLRRREVQRAAVQACRAALPAGLAPLWETVLHAPSLAFDAVSDVLLRDIASDEERLTVILTWFGHGEGACPVCTMLVGKLVYTVPAPIACLTLVLTASPPPPVLHGAALFVATHLEPRHALAAGVPRARLGELQDEVRGLPEPLKGQLRAAWRDRRGDAARLPALD